MKVGCNTAQRAEIMKIAELMQARIVDVSPASLTLEFTDTLERTETLVSLLRPYSIREIVRTGMVAIEKGAQTAKKMQG